MARVLIVAPNWIGDTLLAQPLFARLHASRPGLALHAVAPSWTAPVLARIAEEPRSVGGRLRHRRRAHRKFVVERQFLEPDVMRVHVRAGFDRTFNFHSLRHTALTTVYRTTRDIRLTQRVARHKSVETTIVYAAPSDEDIWAAVRGLNC